MEIGKFEEAYEVVSMAKSIFEWIRMSCHLFFFFGMFQGYQSAHRYAYFNENDWNSSEEWSTWWE